MHQQQARIERAHLPGLVASIRPAVEAATRRNPASLLEAATEQNVRQSVARLATSAPILGGMAESGAVRVVGGIYDLATGRVNLV